MNSVSLFNNLTYLPCSSLALKLFAFFAQISLIGKPKSVVFRLVSIVNADGSIVEEGDAVRQANGLDWLYTATVANESLTGDKIVVRASDKPGNITTVEQAV